MYLEKLIIKNIRAIKSLEMNFPAQPAGWHVIIGDNGAGKSTFIRAISLGLIGPTEVRAAHPNFAEWLRKDAKSGSVELGLAWDAKHDSIKGLGKSRKGKAKVLLQQSYPFSQLIGGSTMIEAVADEQNVKANPTKYLWGNTAKGWFSAGFGPFRRFTGGDAEHDKVYLSSPRCGAHLSVFGEDVALTEALRWLKEIDYKQLKSKEERSFRTISRANISDDINLSNVSEIEESEKVKQLWDIAYNLRENSLFKEAESLYLRALSLSEQLYGPQSFEVATSLNYLHNLLLDTNRLKEAELFVRRALSIAENLGPDNSLVSVSLSNLAILLLTTNRPKEAEPLLRRALAIAEASNGPDHRSVASGLNNLADLLRNTNRQEEAEPLMRRALAIDEANYGSNHSKIAIRLNNLGLLLLDTNRIKEAELLLRRALAIDEANYGPNHSKIAIRLNNLATLLEETNRPKEAEPLLRRALAIAEAGYGPDHPKVATSLGNLANLLGGTDRQKEAEPLLRRSLAIAEASYGPDHPMVAITLGNLAHVLRDTDRQEEAESLLRRALAIAETSYEPGHPNVAISLNNLARLLEDTNRQEEAEPLLRRALAITEASYGPDHPSVATSLSNLAGLLEGTNRQEEAEPLMRRALDISKASYDSLPVATVTTSDANKKQELPLDENDWLAIRLRTFINESELLPSGTEFKGMSTEGPIFRDGNGQTVAITQLSDGFRSILSLAFELIRQLIRVYGLVAVFPPDGMHAIIKLPGIVLIDEIDTHLHPTWQTRIGQWFTKCFPQIQFIVTTHSPLVCRAVTENTGSIWRLPTPGQGFDIEEVQGIERHRLRLGTVLDAYGTGLFGGEEVEQAAEASEMLDEKARLSAKESVGKVTLIEQARLRELRQLFSSTDATVEY